MVRLRHSGLDMADPDVFKKKQDVLSKARNKLFNFGDTLKSNKSPVNGDGDQQLKKSRTQATIDYFFKSNSKNDKVYANSKCQSNEKKTLQKQNSIGAYPLENCNSDTEIEFSINRARPATICTGRTSEECRETAALALERPRKKHLSFREPEISGYAVHVSKDPLARNGRKSLLSELRRPYDDNEMATFEDLDDLEGQAMRVVRTIGQAFEVCHKLSINAPEIDYPDQDEDTLTQDLISDRLSDIHSSDKSRKDVVSNTSEKKSSEIEECSLKGHNDNDIDSKKNKDIAENNPSTNNGTTKRNHVDRSAMIHSEGNLTGSGANSSHPSSSSALSAQHELQLLREQLDQQTQQTQAALAQLQLVREQLAAEQSARLEAQARTQQLLIHNKELLDHIAALVTHLQGGGEKTSGPQQNVPQMNIPQTQHVPLMDEYLQDRSESGSLEQSPVLQGLIENIAVTSCLPPSPLRTSFNPSGGVFNFNYSTPQDMPFESQLLQRLQTLCGYTPPTQYSHPYNQSYLSPLFTQPLVNNTYPLQPPPQKKLSPSLHARHSYSESPASERRYSPVRSTEEHFQSMQQVLAQQSNHLLQVSQNIQQRLSPQQLSPQPQSSPQPSSSQSSSQTPSQSSSQQRVSPRNETREPQFIKPLSQMGTLTTTDTEGRVRVIVPIPSSAADDDSGNLLSSIRLGDELRRNITRTTSEKVPNRSELMSQVQRTAWARHTTK